MAEDKLIVSVSGVRGTIGGTLTPQVASDFGCAFAVMLGAGRKVVLGRDTRPSGPMIADAVTAGMLAGGLNVVDLGVVTTPGVALMTRKLGADGAVVVTASHNPARYNGIKFLQPAGCGLTAEMAARLGEIWRAGGFAPGRAGRRGRLSRDGSTHRKHVAAVCDACDVEVIRSGKFKVALDSINGAGCQVTPMLLDRLGCRLVHINGEPTGRFAHEPEPIEQNLGSLCAAVKEYSADVGFGQDPDADRLVVVDETGTFIGEEYTLALAAAQVLRHRKGKLATNLATSRMIDDVAAGAGAEVVRAPTGEANVVEAMMRENCIFGGEGNGGVIDPQVVPVRDSLVGIATVLQAMAETHKTVSQLVGELPSYVMLKTKLACPAGAAAEAVRRTRQMFEGVENAKINDSDGLRVDLPDGWLSVRASNTEPIMRIIAEARSRRAAEELVQSARKIADEVIGNE